MDHFADFVFFGQFGHDSSDSPLGYSGYQHLEDMIFKAGISGDI